MTISGERTEQLNIFCRITGFTSDFLSFIDVELIRFFHGALQLYLDYHQYLVISYVAHHRPCATFSLYFVKISCVTINRQTK